ncbi:MAG: hypothetical protein AAB373_05010 [Patescibacteria group bacterium]
MNSHLQGALNALSGAKGVPGASIVEKAADHTSWHGTTKSGDTWELTKNSIDSYNIQTGV